MPTKHIFVISPDFSGAYVWHYRKTSDGKHSRTCGFSNWEDQHKIPGSLFVAFERWQDNFEHAPDAGQEFIEQLNWRQFHAEGLELSRRLKATVQDKARVIYVKPIEDRDHEFLEHQEILLGGDILDVTGIQFVEEDHGMQPPSKTK